MRKYKGETGYLILLPTNSNGARGLDRLAQEGRVYGISYRGVPSIVATRRQLRKLDRAGIQWEYAQSVREHPRATKAERPFGQPRIARAQAVFEPFEGPAYKFYLHLPRYRNGQAIFEPLDGLKLFLLLIDDFGGCRFLDEATAPVTGGWKLRAADQIEPAVDLRRSYTVYTKPTQASKAYFRRLEANLRKHLLFRKGMQEKQIIIERRAVEIIKGGD